MRRRIMFIPAFLFAVLSYAALFWFAPDVPLFAGASRLERLDDLFRVRIWDEADVPQFQLAPGAPTESLTDLTRLRDVLTEELAELPPAELPERTPEELEDLARRASAETVERDHDLTPESDQIDELDTKILQIEEQTARENIEVARRLAEPATEEVLPSGALPTLRTPGVDGDQYGFSSLPRALDTLEGEALDAPGATGDLESAGTELPSFEGELVFPDLSGPNLPELPGDVVLPESAEGEQIADERPYEFLDDLLNIDVTAFLEPGGRRGYFRLQISPRSDLALAVLTKQVTYIIDASTSILQRKLDLTARGIIDSLGMLRPEDRFNVIVFRDSPTMLFNEPLPANAEAKRQAAAFLEGVESRGATDVYSALRPVLVQPPPGGIGSFVLVATDGRPTSGNLAGRNLINALTADNVHRNTVHTIGAGRTVNQYLLDLLAYQNKGQAEIVPQLDAVDTALPRFASQFRDPLLVNLSADYGRIDRNEVFPRELPDFYAGRVVTVYGAFDPRLDKEIVMRLEGVAGTREKEVIFKADLQAAATGSEEIARAWAFQKVYYLIGEITRRGETPELMAQLRDLSRRYSIRTTYYQ